MAERETCGQKCRGTTFCHKFAAHPSATRSGENETRSACARRAVSDLARARAALTTAKWAAENSALGDNGSPSAAGRPGPRPGLVAPMQASSEIRLSALSADHRAVSTSPTASATGTGPAHTRNDAIAN